MNSERGPSKLIRGANANEVHLRVCSPENIMYCRMAAPHKEGYNDRELAANKYPDYQEKLNFLHVDSVNFIGTDDFAKCITEGSNLKPCELCMGCYSGDFSWFV